RQVPYGDFGGGISDDTDLTEQWPGLALMGVDPDKIRDSLNALCEAAYKNNMFTGGLATLVTDELHSYEDGINSNSEAFYLNWGEPLVAERLMQTAKDLTDRIILTNPNGHMHFATNWFGGPKVYREGPWEWGKPYSYVITHPLLLLGQYNANPIARKTVIGLADGYLAHGKQGQDGVWNYPEEINWRTDAERGKDLSAGTGLEAPLQDFWAAWRWTNDAKYLRPLESVAAKSGPQALGLLNEDVIEGMGHLGDWGKALTARAGRSGSGKGDGFDAYMAWVATGDVRWLEKLHAAAIQSKSQRIWMETEGHWWVDRVELPSEILQRERLGGVALKRNHLYPGHTVSWRFAEPDGAELVAILLSEVSPNHFKVTAYNLADHPLAASMTAWNVTAGHWKMNGDKPVDLERSASVELSFAPGQSIYEFTLDQPVTPTDQRADLGIGRGDVAVDGRGVHVTANSLGALPAPGGTLTLTDQAGKVMASAKVPALEAPTDLLPKKAVVTLTPPKGSSLSGAKIEVSMEGGPEVTRMNNSLVLP
ncbi:MAG TPA: LamG domain-containing protein, partial [Magnetospirillaceae bacterium]|nr:LamG domain-containing protein [Magnetospirillaceae bacterium]